MTGLTIVAGHLAACALCFGGDNEKNADPSARSAKRIVRVVESRTEKTIDLATLADRLAARDLVFLGEEHDNPAGHQAYAQLLTLLSERRADMVVSMEMFERDVQGVVDDYLRGRLTEAEFLRISRPWKNYATDYRPAIELAKAKRLDVIAGNLPRPVASQIGRGNAPMSPFLPRSTSAAKDGYWTGFLDAMKGHPGPMDGVEAMYRSQCAKDDAMAEGIADYLARNPHRQPLVVHRCGKFHSDGGLGTVARVASRVPLAEIGVVTMAAVPDVDKAELAESRRKAHFVLFVPEAPRPPAQKAAPPPAGKSTKAAVGKSQRGS